MNIGSIASQMMQQNPMMRQFMQGMAPMSQNASPSQIIDGLMQRFPALQNNQALMACKNKSPQEIQAYAEKYLGHMGYK